MKRLNFLIEFIDNLMRDNYFYSMHAQAILSHLPLKYERLRRYVNSGTLYGDPTQIVIMNLFIYLIKIMGPV